MKEVLAIVAAILAFAGHYSYLKDVIKGRIKPHPYTWFVWSIVSLVTFFGQVQKGAGIGALPTAVAEVFTVFIFIFSLTRFSKEQISHFHASDHLFLVLAVIGLVPWFLTSDPTISVITVVIIDVIAFIPTIRKTWVHPKTEKTPLYGWNIGRHIFTLFSLQSYNVATTLHSISMLFTNTIMFLVIRLRNRRI